VLSSKSNSAALDRQSGLTYGQIGLRNLQWNCIQGPWPMGRYCN